MMLQLNPMIPVKWVENDMNGFAFIVIDYSQEHDILYVCAMENGEIWTLNNKEIRFRSNITMERKL